MTVEDILIYAAPIGTFAIIGTAAYFSAKLRNTPLLTLMGLVWAGFTGLMFLGMANASGWDGFGFLLALIFLAAPAGAGFGIGGLVGWLRGKRIRHA